MSEYAAWFLTDDDVLTPEPDVADAIATANLAATPRRHIEHNWPPTRIRTAASCPSAVTLADERVAAWLGVDPEVARDHVMAVVSGEERAPLERGVERDQSRYAKQTMRVWIWTATENDYQGSPAARDEVLAVIAELRHGLPVARARVAAVALYQLHSRTATHVENERAERHVLRAG